MEDIPLFDSPGAQLATIVTDGDTIKPILNTLDSVDGECKLTITEDGIHTRLTDRANVFMLNEFRVDADAFDTYNVHQEDTIGVNVGELKRMVRRARKHQDDELTISISERELTTKVERGYDNHNVVSQGETKLIDPASLRQEPNELDMEHDVQITVDKCPLVDALEYGTTTAASHVRMSVRGVNQHVSALYVGGETDNTTESVAVDGVDTGETADAMYSGDYVNKILSGIRGIDPESVGVQMNDEYPAAFRMTGLDGSLTVEYVIAPRIQE